MNSTRLNNENGFTLIEVLVAVVVLSIGLLGLAGLQANGMRQNHSSLLRSQATFLAYDIADRIRANRQDALDNNAYNIAAGASPSSSGIAQADLTEWKAELLSKLPLGDGSVARAGALFTITVTWDDSRTGAATQSFIVGTQL